MPDEDLKDPAARGEKHDRAIATGAVVNALGIAGKGLFVLFFILATRLYGAEVAGVFLLAYTILEVAESLSVSGFNTGTLMFASRYLESDDREELLYRSLANGFVIALVIAVVLVVLSRLGGPQLLQRFYRQADPSEMVQMMALALPFVVVMKVVIAATKAHLTMKWEAILLGGVRPGLITVLAVAFHFANMGASGLVLAYVVTQVVAGTIALVVFGWYFSYRSLFGSIRRFRLFTPMLSFAIPQNLNTAFGTLVTNLDLLMLGLFDFKGEALLFYGMGARIVRQIRQVKLAVSESFAPVIARLHDAGRIDELNRTFSRVTRWVVSLGLPLGLVVALLRGDLLRLFDSSFAGDTTFMLLLLVPPLLSCGFGLAGNIVVMTGHSKWNLMNSLTVAGVNAVLNLVLIPRYGVLGAASATVLASTTLTVMQLVEARLLVGARLVPSQVIRPYLAMVPAAAVAVIFGVWVDHVDALPARIGMAVLSTATFAGMLLLLGKGSTYRDRLAS